MGGVEACVGIGVQNSGWRNLIGSGLRRTIPDVVEAIRGIGQVLKPGGQFIFFEHGLSPDPRVRRWQERTDPLFQWAFEGCHVTRDIPSLVTEGGFKIEQMKTAYLAPFPKSGSYFFWGVARPEV
jgi:hypothetical protein